MTPDFKITTGKQIDELYNRVSKTGEIDFELKKGEDGNIEFRDNPEFLILYMGWLRKHNPKLITWVESQSPCNSSLDPRVTYQEAYDQGTLDYKNSPIKIKRQMRRSKIKFIRWWNKKIAKGNQAEFTVPTMFEPNKLGEKLYEN